MRKYLLLFFSSLICIAFTSILYAEEYLLDDAQTGIQNVREPAVAGRFYAGTEAKLRKQVSNLLNDVFTENLPGKPVALISPHAGYQYSGLVAAYGYNAIKDYDYKRVIIIAPSHYSRYTGASIPDVDYYKTPLGLIKLDMGACNNLINNPPLIGTFKQAHAREHSLETQLPFLQTALKDFELVPILISRLNNEAFDFLVDKIKPLINEDTLIIVSSDFTHYGYGYSYVPFKKDIEASIRKLDYGAFERILALDFDGFFRYKKATGITACGFMPIALLLKLLPDDAQGKILHYDTSGNQMDDFNSSVSYASIMFTRGRKSSGIIDENPSLNNNEQATLLRVARDTLETYIRERKLPDVNNGKYTFTQKLKEKRGVFVTLNKNGGLRGCIGHILPREPLFKAVMKNTVSSSTNDMRFMPVSEDELTDLEIDISVLSPIKKISGPEKFIPGKHGIIIRMLGSSAVFLPQVATEQGAKKQDCQHTPGKMMAWNYLFLQQKSSVKIKFNIKPETHFHKN
ncbi:MAG: AmmeMemoRadiSam system protein B [Planctomycetota bacterium]|jgi:AmmeMemoRadiSam system protein B/AmmeMemoRadiSam system protein A